MAEVEVAAEVVAEAVVAVVAEVAVAAEAEVVAEAGTGVATATGSDLCGCATERTAKGRGCEGLLGATRDRRLDHGVRVRAQ